MGKNSLIKSTTKKTPKVKKETEAKVNSEEKIVAPPSPKATSKADAASKPDSTVKPKSTPKPAAADKPEKVAKPSVPKQAAQPPKTTKTEPKEATPPPPPAAETPRDPEPPVTVTYDTPSGPSTGEPMDKTLMILAGCVLFLFLLVIGASASNSARYYINKLPVGIEILKGRFAPLGEDKIMVLPDINAPEEKKSVYKRDDVYPLIFKHYLQKADALLASPGMPDYENIRAHLAKAQNFAVSNELAEAASKRLTAIDLNNLLYRSDVAYDQDTVEGLETALDHLAEAARLDIDPDQQERINLQKESIRERLRELKEIEAALEVMPKEPAVPTH